MGPYLSAPITEKKTSYGENSKVFYASSEMQGWRNTMEDAKIVNLNLDTDTMLFGVFDGHGGKEVAEFVSKHFCIELINCRAYRAGNYEQALKDTFMRMDELLRTTEGLCEVIRIAKKLPDDHPVQPDPRMMVAGCTSVVALIHENTLFVANAGDSRCVLNREGTAIDLSTDHKPNLPAEYDRITKAGGSVSDGRIMGNLNLSRSIGDLDYKDNSSLPQKDQMITAYPEIRIEYLTHKDQFLVLACDGVWDMLTSQNCINLISTLKSSQPLPAVAEEVLNRCLASDFKSSGGKGCDNTTIIIVEFKH